MPPKDRTLAGPGDHGSHARSAEMQDAQGGRLVARLGGVWRNGKGLCLCPAHADHDPSLSVRVGERALLFKCFAGCTTIDVLRAIHRLGLPMANSAAPHTPYRPTNTSAGIGTALRAWNASVPLAGTLAEAYLSRRSLKPQGDDLRFNAHTPLGRGSDVVFRPAMLAAVREHRTIVAVHRTFLDPAGLDPAGGQAGDLTPPRMLLGSPGGGAVQLMPASRVLGLAEGIETALAAMEVHRIPVWATLGTARADRIALPDGLERLVLLFDRDAAGSAACRRARKAYVRLGLELNDIWPPVPHNDWADLLVSIRRNHSKSGG